MDRLILLRHGKAEARAASGEDFDRPLTPRGWRDARLIANAVAEAGFAPDRAVVSAAVRTRETWEAVAPTFPGAILETALALRALAPAVEARLRDGFATGAAAAFGFAEDRVEALGLYYPADYGGGPD